MNTYTPSKLSKLGLAIAAAALTAACGSASVSPKVVQAKAASDMSCEASQITTHQITDGNWTAKGCGKQASYVCSGSNAMSAGMCMLEGQVKPQ